jgi:hypothetical protein
MKRNILDDDEAECRYTECSSASYFTKFMYHILLSLVHIGVKCMP